MMLAIMHALSPKIYFVNVWDGAKVLQQKENAKRKCIGKGKGN
jgi:hypothetical protein